MRLKSVTKVGALAVLVIGCSSASSDNSEDDHVTEGIEVQSGTISQFGTTTAVSGAVSEILNTETGFFLRMSTSGLTEGNVYSMYVAVANEAGGCDGACTVSQINADTTKTGASIYRGDAAVGKVNGKEVFSAYIAKDQTYGLVSGSAYTNVNTGHVVAWIMDHGPAVSGSEKNQFTTFAGGCTAASVASFPAGLQSDGTAGSFTCSGIQETSFDMSDGVTRADFIAYTPGSPGFDWHAQGAGSHGTDTGTTIEAGSAAGDKDAVTFISSPTGVYIYAKAQNLTAGNVFTVWVPIANEPENCAGFTADPQALCTPKEIVNFSKEDGDIEGEVTWGDGVIADADGMAHASSYIPIKDDANPDPYQWMEVGLKQPQTSELHYFFMRHGALIDGSVGNMLNTANGGCADDTIPGFFPASSKQGTAGENTCRVWQVAGINMQFATQVGHSLTDWE